MDHSKGQRTEEIVEDPMVVPRRIMESWTPQRVDELPEAFCGGWVGYFSYDTVRFVEKKLPFLNAPNDDRNLPDVHLGLYDDVIVFDHVEKKAFVIHWVHLGQFASVEEAYNDGMDRLDTLMSRVHDIVPPRLAAGSIKLSTSLFGPSLKNSSMSSDAYKEAGSFRSKVHNNIKLARVVAWKKQLRETQHAERNTLLKLMGLENFPRGVVMLGEEILFSNRLEQSLVEALELDKTRLVEAVTNDSGPSDVKDCCMIDRYAIKTPVLLTTSRCAIQKQDVGRVEFEGQIPKQLQAYRFKIEECSHTALKKFNVISNSSPEWKGF
ncbi:hypothetical protein POM88_047754 [Heracleum sosnowskyi]|uniref:Anthranilate synthase component I N-terminal domain-containing protein n=1 Tax=Heracleum sosnowskyi TaxID=360622 RepID=A0AAD8LZX1_9APIA|nr:hypothetical protein POM88_047754 [Heracleum sosnowskyi]